MTQYPTRGFAAGVCTGLAFACLWLGRYEAAVMECLIVLWIAKPGRSSDSSSSEAA